jgi:ribose transport system ATP-binding protein
VELLYQLKEKGITIIILSLNVADSLSIADRMMLMEDGRIIKNYEKKDFDMFI